MMGLKPFTILLRGSIIESLRTPGLEAVPSKEAIYEPVKRP